MRTIFFVSIVMVVLMASLTLAGAQAPANTAGQAPVTFTKDVAPILQNRCQVCHRPDTFAPMSLLTYEDARPWARSIKEKVATREMPPWYIDKNVGVRHFTNDVSLSEEEIATIVKWVDSGAAKGNPRGAFGGRVQRATSRDSGYEPSARTLSARSSLDGSGRLTESNPRCRQYCR